VQYRHIIKAALKRGALVAAANWPVTLIQAAADGVFKLWIAVPLLGGVLLVTLVIGGGTEPLDTVDWRVLATQIVTSLASHRLVLLAFVLSLGVVVAGGSLFVFLVKAGTVGVLVGGERRAPPVDDESWLEASTLAGASAFSMERFIDSARTLFPRYARLGFLLMSVYAGSAVAYLGLVVAAGRADTGWWIASVAAILFVAWTTLVNFVYLLVQLVMAAEDCSVTEAMRRVRAFLAAGYRTVGGVFLVVLAMVLLATVASLLAFAALGLVLVLPFLWLAAVPLQLLAVVVRAVVFQFIALTSIGAYAQLYREFATERRVAPSLVLQPQAGVLEK
jgi:hypothetical protein